MINCKIIKDLREDNDYKQEDIAKYLKVTRSTYANWECGDARLPLFKADLLSLFYNVPLSYLLGITTKYNKEIKIKKLNYDKLLKKLNELKKINNHSYIDIAIYLNRSSSTVCDYYKGKIIIPLDVLILLSEYYKIDIDELCFKI